MSRSKTSPVEPPPRAPSPARTLLTEENLRALTEINATSPSRAASAVGGSAPSTASARQLRRQQLLQRRRSDPSLNRKKSIDDHLAYGDVPPDLESRVDLDTRKGHNETAASEEAQLTPQEEKALNLLDKIEDFLEEAQCMHQTASAMIDNLQKKPEAAAAVALTLAELSSMLGKMSPSFLAFLKGGSPAVFALLSSPQFLIGASVALGVTVIMFGGLKIVKRIKEIGGRAMEMPFAAASTPAATAAPADGVSAGVTAAPGHDQNPAEPPPPYDEAVVLKDIEEGLSRIDAWRRGIPTFSETEQADLEAMAREAEEAMRELHFEGCTDEIDPSDSVSQVSRAPRSRYSSAADRHHHSARSTYKSYKSRRERKHREEEEREKDKKRRDKERERDGRSEVSVRSSSRRDKDREEKERDGRSEISVRSYRSSRDKDARSEVSHRSSREKEKREDSSYYTTSAKSEVSVRSLRRKSYDDASVVSSRSRREYVSEVGSAVGAPKPKEKKRELIKQLFKMKKEKEEQGRAMSVVR